MNNDPISRATSLAYAEKGMTWSKLTLAKIGSLGLVFCVAALVLDARDPDTRARRSSPDIDHQQHNICARAQTSVSPAHVSAEQNVKTSCIAQKRSRK